MEGILVLEMGRGQLTSGTKLPLKRKGYRHKIQLETN